MSETRAQRNVEELEEMRVELLGMLLTTPGRTVRMLRDMASVLVGKDPVSAALLALIATLTEADMVKPTEVRIAEMNSGMSFIGRALSAATKEMLRTPDLFEEEMVESMKIFVEPEVDGGRIQ